MFIHQVYAAVPAQQPYKRGRHFVCQSISISSKRSSTTNTKTMCILFVQRVAVVLTKRYQLKKKPEEEMNKPNKRQHATKLFLYQVYAGVH